MKYIFLIISSPKHAAFNTNFSLHTAVTLGTKAYFCLFIYTYTNDSTKPNMLAKQ